MAAEAGTLREDYHALLARHEAMRLRRNLFAPGTPAREAGSAYDGAADQRIILRDLPLVLPFDQLILDLYAAMFERRPYLRSLFPESMEFQREHLARIFQYLIDNLHRPDAMAATLRQLGSDHRKLGVREAHYEAFEEALCEALYRGAGPRWTRELEGAWTRMLRFAVAAMVDGAEAAMGEPLYFTAEVSAHELRGDDLAVLRVRTAEPYPYRAGQYAAVESMLLPQAWRHYSLARAPRPDGELEFHVRRTARGGVSEALVDRTRAGDTLRLGPARGTLTADGEPARDLLLVAGGTGWAPLRALLEDLARRREPGRGAHLFLGVRHRDDLYDLPAVTGLEQRCPWLRVTPVVAGEHGTVADAVARHGDWSGHVACVSGPPPMVAAVTDVLAAMGVPPERIRHDPAAAQPR
ncbi:Flavohemoprotein [Streptomyces sp. RB5]|uniref:nitric oxide dioxygenase n=1 Tax=Streptomyces smaragdinus TaxID=2585196 RepID=A0A7K0CRN9_9ACTN|nr:globin domain-containing protein [Streptomyces smaragdinus]MQY16158.1 Flavohemoprotein [Streptomyces smaragdinus]